MKKLFLFCTLCISTSLLAIDMPTQAWGMPEIFNTQRESYTWSEISNDKIASLKTTSNPWRVFLVDNNAVAYESAYSDKILSSDIEFMEDFYVASIEGERALLFYFDEKLIDLNIPNFIKKNHSKKVGNTRKNGYIGWVNLEDLLLWTICPYTKDGIFQKVAIAKDLNHSSSGTFNRMPEMFLDKDCKISANPTRYVNALDFYFAFKKSSKGNVLVFTEYKMANSMNNRIVGWIEYGQFIDWNTRICWEPAFQNYGDPLNDYAYTFKTRNGAKTLDIPSNVRTRIPLKERKNVQTQPRSPVLDYNSTTKIAELSVLANMQGNNNIDVMSDVERLQQKVEILKNSLSQINIVFVMDATISMKHSFPAMSKAVQNIARTNFDDGRTKINFGVVAYRNHADKGNPKYKFIESCPLTQNIQSISKFLDGIECGSSSSELQEAMFAGLNYAADNMKWDKTNSNYIILISDVTSKDPDADGLTKSKIIQKLADKRINLLAFQACNQGNTHNRNFGSQVCDIITGILKKLGYPTKNISNSLVDKTNIKLSLYEPDKNNTKWPLRPMGFQFSTNQNVNPQELESLATYVIKNFITTTQRNIKTLEEQINKALAGGIDIEVDDDFCTSLIEEGLIRNCDDLKKIGVFKVLGYTKQWNWERRMFVPCVFLADKELKDLTTDIQRALRSSSSGSKRLEVSEVCKKLILSYTGQKLNSTSISTDFPTIIESIEKETGCRFYKDVITHMEDPNILSDSEFNVVVNHLSSGLNHLLDIQNDDNDRTKSYKQQGKQKYYYILLKDMPLVMQQ